MLGELAGVGVVALGTGWAYQLLVWPWARPAKWLTTDFTLQFYPWLYYSIKSLWSGEIPWWCPLSGCGEPLLAKLETAPLFPGHLLLGLACGGPPGLWEAQLYQVVMIWLGGVGVYAFCRAAGVGRGGSALAGVLFATSRELVYHSVYITFTDVAPLMGLLLAACLMALKRASGPWLAAAGLALGVSLLGGNPQWSHMHVMALGLMWICWVLQPSRLGKWEHWWEVLWPLGVVVVLGLALAVVQLGPSWELLQFSPRAHPTLEFASMDRFSYPSNISATIRNFTFTAPAVVVLLAGVGLVAGQGRVVLGLVGVVAGAMELARGADSLLFRACYHLVPGFGLFRYPGRFIHLGVFGLAVLAGMGLEGLWGGKQKRRLLVGLGAGVVAVGILWAMGITPRARNEWAAFILGAGAAGVGAWAGDNRWVRRAAVGAIVAAMAVCSPPRVVDSSRWVAQHEDFYATTPVVRYLQQHAGHERTSNPGALITHIQARDYWSYHRFKFLGGLIYSIPTWATAGQLHMKALDEVVRLSGYPRVYDLLGIRYLPQGLDPPPRPEGRYKPWGLAAGERMQLALEGPQCRGQVKITIRGEGVVEVVRGGGKLVKRFNGRVEIQGRLPAGQLLELRMIRGRGVVEGVVAGGRQLLGGRDRWSEVIKGLWVNRWGLPKIFIVQRYELAPNPARALKALVGLEPARVVVLDRPPHYSPPGAPAHAQQLRLVSYKAHEMVVECALVRPGVLVVLDSWYPGWKVWVDGRAQSLLKADYMFRAVALGPGRHRVVMRYCPWWMGWIWLGPVAAAGLGLWVGISSRRWRWPAWMGRGCAEAARSARPARRAWHTRP